MCLIDLANDCAAFNATDRPTAEQYTKRRGNLIELVIRYTQRPLIGFPLESKASRVKYDRRGGTSVPIGGMLQTAPRRVRDQLVARKQIVRLPRGNKICAGKMRLRERE